MAAYAAVISLKHTINGRLKSSRLSPVSSTGEFLKSAYDEITSLQKALESLRDGNRKSRSSCERLDALEEQIRDCAHKLEDVLEFDELNAYEDEEVIRQEITSFAEAVKKLAKDYIEEVASPVTDDYDDAAIDLPNIDSGAEMVGSFDQFTGIRKELISRVRPDDMCYFAIIGEDGTGRTMLARTIFDDLGKGTGERKFDCCAWVTLGTEFEWKEVLIGVLVQVFKLAARYHEFLKTENIYKLSMHVAKLLEHQRYMIVLDDVPHSNVMECWRKILPYQSNGSLVIVTTRFKEIIPFADFGFDLNFPATYADESAWSVLRTIIFASESISQELEEAGRMIIQNCRGLLVSISKAKVYLMKTERTLEQWSKLAADKENPIFKVVDEISEINRIKADIQSYNWDVSDKTRIQSYIWSDIITWISTSLERREGVNKIKMKIHPERFFSKMHIISLLGMAGIGKTTLVTKLFKDQSVLQSFEHQVWVSLGPKYQNENILIDILAQIYPDINRSHMKGDEKLARDLCTQLSCKRCLIVFDDLWSQEPLHHLKHLFPDIKGIILVTTRLAKVAKFGRDDTDFEMQLLDKEESWRLLCQKVFGEGLCPPELEKAGRKIAENCDGLPLLIVTVADQLLKVDMSEKCWNDVASGKDKTVFTNEHRRISKVLLPSFQNLPQNLKPCFLYMGVFCEKYEISISELKNLLIAEGFLETNLPQKVEDFIGECLLELVHRTLLMVQRRFLDMENRTCRLHSVFWHLSNTLSHKNGFLHAMTIYDDCSIESIQSQRRLCIRNSVLLGIKDVQISVAANACAHSLLCVGPLHQYPVPLNFDWRLPRVMNALSIRLYEFPAEVARLFHLRFLGLMFDRDLPTSISNLQKLEYLIVKRYILIKSPRSSCPLPEEIWDMKELKHLQVMGGRLPNHKRGLGLLKLSALLDVSAESCRKEVLKWFPKLKRLGIRTELAPGDAGQSFHCLDDIYGPCGLESLRFVVMNPHIRSQVAPPPTRCFMIPSHLKKLSLSGLGYPWEYMNTIGKLDHLEVLKIKGYAFQGPKWELDFNLHFRKLKFLSVEDTNLVYWKINSPFNYTLERLSIKDCYKLRELPTTLYRCLSKIEIVDCSTSTVTWAEQMRKKLYGCEVKVLLSWTAPKK